MTDKKPPEWIFAKQAAQGLWNHLEGIHNLPGLSPATVRNNKKVWRMAHARMHGMRAGQLGADHEELPDQ